MIRDYFYYIFKIKLFPIFILKGLKNSEHSLEKNGIIFSRYKNKNVFNDVKKSSDISNWVEMSSITPASVVDIRVFSHFIVVMMWKNKLAKFYNSCLYVVA